MMAFDTSNTGDDWDSFVPDTPEPAPAAGVNPVNPAVKSPLSSDRMAPAGQVPNGQASSGGGGGIAGGLLRRFIFIPIMGVIALFGWITTQGTTEATDLQAGDCFVMPGFDEEFDRLDTEDCTLPHDGQIVASITVPSTGPYPDDFNGYWDDVYAQCEASASARVTRVGDLPLNTELLFFSPTEASWDAGDRGSLCYISSTDGLDGSFVSATLGS